MSLGGVGWQSAPAAVNVSRDPSGYSRRGAFGTAHRCVTTTEQSLDFQSHAQGRLPVTTTLFILEQRA